MIKYVSSAYFNMKLFGGVCKYYIGPIGDLSLLTATATTAVSIHSLH